MRLLIVGNPARFHVGAHFFRAAQALNLEVTLCDTTHAYGDHTSRWQQRLLWHFGGHRPLHLDKFGQEVLQTCQSFRPTHLLAVGIAPLSVKVLGEIGRWGIARLNFLTDDPWNAQHRAPWFMAALPHYDAVFSPRQANLNDLQGAGVRDVQYLPFAYDPDLHYRPTLQECGEATTNDVVFVGGADEDRVPVMNALIHEALVPALYGGYWDRYATTRTYARGHATPESLRCITYKAAVNICLVRRANRDGHVMRSFEIAACGGAMLIEDTTEHRAIFGDDGETVRYFTNTKTLVARARWMVEHPTEVRNLADAVYHHITTTPNRYQDRLKVMVQ